MNLFLELLTLPKRLGGQEGVLPAGANHNEDLKEYVLRLKTADWRYHDIFDKM